jgi:hypothetical protein
MENTNSNDNDSNNNNTETKLFPNDELIEWFETQTYFSLTKKYSKIFSKILVDSLDIKGKHNFKNKSKKLLIVGDLGNENNRTSAIIISSFVLAAKKLNINFHIELQPLKQKGERMEKNISSALMELPEKNNIILCNSRIIGSINKLGSSFEKFANLRKHKFVILDDLGEIPQENIKELIKGIAINSSSLEKKAKKIKAKLQNANELKITNNLGTEITITNLKTVSINSGKYYGRENGGQLPAGEIIIYPQESINGILFIDNSFRHNQGTTLIERPIKIDIEKGIITSIQGYYEAELLKRSLSNAAVGILNPKNIYKIFQFGLGINKFVKKASSSIVNKKAVNTANITLGRDSETNSSINTSIKFDQVFNNPQFFLDGKKTNLI